MPVYEYQCKACQKDFEYQQRMSDPDKTVCEACGGELERLISRTAFALKGSGWYKDLYSSAKPEAKSSDAKSDGASSSSGDGAAAKSDAPAASAPAPAATPAAAPAPAAPKPTTGGSGGGGTTSKSAAARAQ